MKSSTPALLLVVASLALTATCAHGPVDEQRLATPRVDAELALQLAPKVELGTERTLRLVFELEGATRSHARAIETLFAEALAQSPWFDVAASEDAATSDIGPALVVRGNLQADDRSLLTTSLEGDRSVPLAGVRDFAWPELTTALDRLALETRRTLGEPLPSIEAQKSSCAELVSTDLRVASACGSAKDLVAKSRLALADGTLTQALNRDQGCALAMSLLAGIRMDTGRADSAVEFAKRAMQLERRLSPSAAGRAARVVMLAEGRGSAEIVDFADKTL
ncbi:MAG TPA: hypothetical protein PKE00_10635 [Planctomycetota bacterium]|nr:hypothetical protein [Planctomycetota bacterium]